MKAIIELVDAKVRTREEVIVHPKVITLLSGASFWPQRCLKECTGCDLRFTEGKTAQGQASSQRAGRTVGVKRFGRGGASVSKLPPSSRAKTSSSLGSKSRINVTITGRVKSVTAIADMLSAMSNRCKVICDIERLYVLPKHVRALQRGGARQVRC